jgi:ElaB/YqjD/DUF883 family membrane-anchored ribosome-binding protein
MSNDPKVIQKQMEETRSSLTEKLETLEGKVSNTITSTSDAVQDTTQNVQETITGAVDAVKETVETVTDKVHETVASVTDKVQDTMATMTNKVEETVQALSDTFNLSVQMERRPWVVMGGAFAAGCLLGATLGPSSASAASDETPHASPPPSPYRGTAGHTPVAHASMSHTSTSEEPGVLDGAFSHLKNLGISYLMGMLRDLARRELPEALGKRIAEQVDTLTSNFGGEPIREQLLPEANDNPNENEQRPQGESNPRFRAMAGAKN